MIPLAVLVIYLVCGFVVSSIAARFYPAFLNTAGGFVVSTILWPIVIIVWGVYLLDSTLNAIANGCSKPLGHLERYVKFLNEKTQRKSSKQDIIA